MMKILYLIDRQLDTIGGAQKSTTTTIIQMNKLGYDLYLFSPGPTNITFLKKEKIYLYNQINENNIFNKALDMFYHTGKELVRTINATNPDIIHAQSKRALILLGLLKRFKFINNSIECIITDRQFLSAYSNIYKFFLKLVYKSFDKIICTTEINKKDWEKTFKINNVYCVPNVLDEDWYNYDLKLEEKYKKEFNIEEGIINIGFAGRFQEYKRWDTVKKICEEFKDNKSTYFSFAIAPMANQSDEKINEYIKELKHLLGDRIRIFFKSDNKQMKKFYYTLDIFILTSENESFGRTLIEAMTKNVLVLATNSGGVPDVIKNTKYLFEVDDVERIKKIIDTYIKDKVALDNEKKYFMNFVNNNYTIENFTNSLKKIYNN